MTTWFIADTHFGHEMILRHSKRPFSDVYEMDNELIHRWNARVAPNEDVYHLGDFSFRATRTPDYYLSQLHGRIHIIWGNHDKDTQKYSNMFASHQEVLYLKLNKKKITLYHYAQRVWRDSHHGSWHLYGHSHGSLPHYHRSMDVGVDAHDYAPISFEEIQAYMNTQPVTNHHPEEAV